MGCITAGQPLRLNSPRRTDPFVPRRPVLGWVGSRRVRSRGPLAARSYFHPAASKRPSTGRACLHAASGAVDAPHRNSRFGVVQVLVVVLDLLTGSGCRPGHRRGVAGRPARDARGTDVTGPANAGVEPRAVRPWWRRWLSGAGSLRRSVARLGGRPRGGELHPLLGREEPLQDGGAQLVDGVRGVGGVVLVRQPVTGRGAGSPGWRAGRLARHS